MDKYKITRNLGDGTYGVVFEAINIETNEKVAIKQMKQEFKTWDDCINLREIKALRKMNHHNIVKLKEVLKVNNQLYLVFEHMDINIYQYYLSQRDRKQKIPERIIKSIIYQTAQGLSHMHKNGYFHRDLKPENLLISEDRQVVKVCDFGLAREIRSRPPFTDYVSTRWYRAPELLLKSTNYNSPIDIFALGCIMIELYLLNPIWAGSSEIDHLYKIVETLGTPTIQVWPDALKLAGQAGFLFPQRSEKIPIQQYIPQASPEAIQLLEMMLQYDPSKRPTAAQILLHPYFNGCIETIQNNSSPPSSLSNIQPTYTPLTYVPLSETSQQIISNYEKSQNIIQNGLNNVYQVNQNTFPNAPYLAKNETERTNRELYQQKENQKTQYDDSLWNYQYKNENNLNNVFQSQYQNTFNVLTSNNGTRQNQFKQEGLGINSIKNPGQTNSYQLNEKQTNFSLNKYNNQQQPSQQYGTSEQNSYITQQQQNQLLQKYSKNNMQKSSFSGNSTWNLSEYKNNNYNFMQNDIKSNIGQKLNNNNQYFDNLNLTQTYNTNAPSQQYNLTQTLNNSQQQNLTNLRNPFNSGAAFLLNNNFKSQYKQYQPGFNQFSSDMAQSSNQNVNYTTQNTNLIDEKQFDIKALQQQYNYDKLKEMY